MHSVINDLTGCTSEIINNISLKHAHQKSLIVDKMIKIITDELLARKQFNVELDRRKMKRTLLNQVKKLMGDKQ